MDDENFMTPQQVAELLKVDRSTVNRWCREKKLKSCLINPRVRRIRYTDVETFLCLAERSDQS